MNKKITMSYVDSLSGRQFELLCDRVFKLLNYNNVVLTKATNDFGLDIMFKDAFGRLIGIQCKHEQSDKGIGHKAIQQTVDGKIAYHMDIGIVLTNSYFTNSTLKFAKRLHIVCWDRTTLKALISSANNMVKPRSKKDLYPNLNYKIPILINSEITLISKLVFLVIYNANCKSEYYKLSNKRTAQLIGVSSRSVARSLKQLRDADLIHIFYRRDSIFNQMYKGMVVNIYSRSLNVKRVQRDFLNNHSK